ncbi:MAG: ABC transporter permease [Pirellulaceae bacterium]|nr:ABC transporter permease [Pirellulaceae bacterium]
MSNQATAPETSRSTKSFGTRSPGASSAVSDWPFVILIRTRLLEFSRRPAAVFWTYVFPLVMMFILGSAFRSQGESVSQVAIVAGNHAAILLDKLKPSPELAVTIVQSEEGLRMLRAGRLALLMRESANTAATSSATSERWEFVYDPQRPGGRTAELLVQQQLRVSAGADDSQTIPRVLYSEPGGRYIDFLVPGLIGMVLLGGGLWGVGYAIVDMRIRKLLKRYLATPMRKSDFLLGIVFSRLLFVVPQIAVILLASHLTFSVAVHGSWFDFSVVVLLGSLQFAGVGLLIASRAKTIETMSGLINLVMLPMWTLSGIFFSYENFPEMLHIPIRILPLTSLLDVLRGIMLDGRPMWAFPLEMTSILLWTVGTFVIALWNFRWTD